MQNGNLALAGRYLAPAQGRASRRFSFTEKRLAALPLPDAGQVEYQDATTPGFVCRTSRTARTLYVRRRQRGAGKVVFVRLGVVGEKPLAEFRVMAESVAAQLGGGAVPTTALPKRGTLTLGRALDDYLAAKEGKLATGTVVAYKADFDALLGSLRTRPINSPTLPTDVARRHRERSAESPSRADGGLRVLRAVCRYAQASAAARGETLAVDPLAMVRAAGAWNRVQRRATYLDPARRAEWVTAVLSLPDDKGNALTGTQRDALLLLAATGLRLREAIRLEWSEVDLKAGTLTLGGERMKGGREHRLPVPKRTLAMLKARRAANRDGAFVFPGPKRDEAGERLPLDRISRQVFDAIGVSFTPHDLRRTVATWLGANAPAYVVRAVLSHADPSKSPDVTAGYVILDVNDLRPWLDKWEAALYAIPKPRRESHE
jgi:integrase